MNVALSGADMEEHNSNGETPFHVALRVGSLPIIKYLFESHSPEDDEAIYDSPPGTTLLTLALESRDPEVFWTILDKGLASKDDMSNSWAYITSNAGRDAILKAPNAKKAQEKLDEYINLLTTFGGFTLPSSESDNTSATSEDSATNSTTSEEQDLRSPTSNQRSPEYSPASSADRRSRSEQTSDPQIRPSFVDGRGRGRGHGRGRGRGRGRGQERGRGGRGYFNNRGGPPPS